MGCDILTVSTDTQLTHLAGQRSEKELANVKYTMGADPTAKVSRLFGVYNEANGLDLRGSFLIMARRAATRSARPSGRTRAPERV